jgi:hypothetical protein
VDPKHHHNRKRNRKQKVFNLRTIIAARVCNSANENVQFNVPKSTSRWSLIVTDDQVIRICDGGWDRLRRKPPLDGRRTADCALIRPRWKVGFYPSIPSTGTSKRARRATYGGMNSAWAEWTGYSSSMKVTMLITLVAILCNSQLCMEKVVTNSDQSGITMTACQVNAQIGIAEWLANGPYHEWRLKSYKCVMGKYIPKGEA